MPPPGLDALRHVVVMMMENRSFDHLLGSLKAVDPRIDGIDGTQSNPDTQGKIVKAEAKAKYQSQLDPDPGQQLTLDGLGADTSGEARPTGRDEANRAVDEIRLRFGRGAIGPGRLAGREDRRA